MIVDSATAKILASIILVSTQGEDSLTPQLPLQIEDRGDSWLVRGTPYIDRTIASRHVANYVFIRKENAEVVGIGSDARFMLTEQEEREWTKTLSPADYKRLFGPRTRFEAGGEAFAAHMLMNKALYGGLINKSADALAYARALMRKAPRLSQLPMDDLRAEERARVWHITRSSAGAAPTDIMSFSRETGKVLSGDL